MGRKFQVGNIPANLKYKDEYAELMLIYFLNPENKFPTLEDFAVKNNIAIRTLKHWIEEGEKYPRLALAHAQAMAIQKQKLLVGGLTEEFNAQMAKFLLVNNHGMSEKVEQQVKADASFTVEIKVVD